MALKRTVCVVVPNELVSLAYSQRIRRTFVLEYDGDALSMDHAQVSIPEQTDKINLAGNLQGHDSGALEMQIGFQSDFTNQTLEGQLADQQLS